LKIVLVCLSAITLLVTWVTAYLIVGIMEAYVDLEPYHMVVGFSLLCFSAITLRVLVFLIACSINELRSDNDGP